MGKRASSALCLALTVALVLAAVALGAYRGWSGERRQALETFTENTALRDYLEERSMDAANLRVVAARHLDREDEDLAALTQVRKTLTDPEATVEELAAADAELTRLAARLAAGAAPAGERAAVQPGPGLYHHADPHAPGRPERHRQLQRPGGELQPASGGFPDG